MNWSNLSFRRRLLFVMTISGLVNLLVLSLTGFGYLKHWEAQDTGEKALGIAKFLAQSPAVIVALKTQSPQLITDKVEAMRSSINATFIVIGDENGIRYTHPVANRIGKAMKGGDNNRALLLGESYVSFAKGSLGNSVRGKTPVFDGNGDVIGVVSVGYLLTSIDDKVEHFLNFLIGMALLVVLANAFFSNFIAKRFQSSILGFEPEEFGRLYVELEVTLSTIKEGVISIDAEGYVRSVNRSACEILELNSHEVLHKKLKDVLPESDLSDILLTHHTQHDVDVILNGHAIVANRKLIRVDDRVVGAVSSFRLKDELTELTKQLSQIREYADLLRSQTHEHRNKLNTISGMIQLGKTKEVLSLIGQETQHYQQLIRFLRDTIDEPVVAGILLGKSERARELGLIFDIDEGCHLARLPEHIRAEDVVTLIGNFIDNAFDACISNTKASTAQKVVSVSISDYGQEIIIEVEDNGCGLPSDVDQKKLMERGVSTKLQKNRGVGLYLVQQIINQYKGQLVMESENNEGTRMTVFIPKKFPKD